MKLSVMLWGIIIAVIGIILTFTVIGAIIGVPLIIAGVIVFIVGLILPVRV